ILGLDHGAERVAGIGGLISIQAAERKFIFERRVGVLRGRPGAHAERFRFEAREQLAQLLRGRLRNHQATRGRLTVGNGLGVAEFAHALDVAEKIQKEHFLGRKGGEGGGPDLRCFASTQRLAALRFQQLQSYRLGIGAEFQGLDVERIGRQIGNARLGSQRYSSTISPNFSRNSGETLRTSSQSKKASGVSSQMRNHSAISFFSSRRFPSRAISSTRCTAASSPCARNRRISSSRRVRLTSASGSVLKCRMSANSSSKRSSASSRSLSCTFQPVVFSTSAIYSFPVFPASP